jgi:hypothetical protein
MRLYARHTVAFLIILKAEINKKKSTEIFLRKKSLLIYLHLIALLYKIPLGLRLGIASFQQPYCCYFVNAFYKDNKAKHIDLL